MDRNQATGIMLILLLLFVYFQFFAPNPQPKQVMKDTSGAKSTQADRDTTGSQAVVRDTLGNDSLVNEQLKKTYGDFAAAAAGQDQEVVLENKDIRVTFGTRGGRIKEVLLKNYKTYDQEPLILLDEQTSDMTLTLPTNSGNIALQDLFFSTNNSNTQVTEGDSSSITFRLALSPTQTIEQTYSLRGSGFELGYDLKLNGMNTLLSNSPAQYYWLNHLKRLELDMEQSRITSTINYYSTDGNFEQVTEASKSQEEEIVDVPLRWVSLKQKFFLSAIIGNTTAFTNSIFRTNVDEADSNTVKTLEATMNIPIADLQNGKGNFSYYFGPNDYRIVKEVAEGFGENVYFGWPIVRVINRYMIVPLFHFLENFFTNYGVIILILVLIVRLILLPLNYKSYISLAKTKVLQPEIQAIKDKYGDDMAKVQRLPQNNNMLTQLVNCLR